MNWSLGVDFGTSNTAAAYRVDGGPAQPVRLSDQAEQMPSAVLALDSGIMVAGAAVRSARLDPQRFEPSPKRRLGEGEILLGAREWPVPQLIAEVLSHVKQKAMWVAGGQPPQQLILTYPQQWAQGRKDLLRQAAAIAGFDPSTVRLVTEPIAAATWYAATQPVPAGKCVAVFDFGGGTCDVAVLRSNPDAPGTFTVLAADGIDPLGGELLDLRLLEWTLAQLTEGGNKAMVDALSAPENLGAMLTLKEQVRHAKHELGEYESARIPVSVGSVQTVVTITSAEFDKIVGSEIDDAVKLTRRALVASGQTPADLHALYLTGGSSHLRLVHRKMTELLGRPPATLNDPKLVVAQGALLVPPPALEHSSAAPRPAAPLPTGPLPTLHPTQAMPRPPQPPSAPTGPVGPPTGPAGLPTGPFSGPTPVVPAQLGRGPETGGFQGFVNGPPTSQAPVPPAFNQQPPQFPPPGSAPFEQPKKRRPNWLIPAIAAAVVAVIAIVVVFIAKGGDNQAGPNDPVVPSTAPITSEPVETSDCSGSDCGDDGYQRCPNGTTVALDSTCSTEEQISCWDGSEAAGVDGCPALEGEKALEWVFPAAEGWTRDCVEYTGGDKYPGELEVYGCTVDELTDTVMYLSRWDSSASAQSEFTGQMGEPTDFAFDKDPDGQATALTWSKEVTITNDDGTTTLKDAQAVVYKDAPFSILVYYDKTDAGAAAKDAWFNGQLFSGAQSIADRGPAY